MFSASSEARDRNAPTNANQIRLQTSRIRQEASPDSISVASKIEFPTGTPRLETDRRAHMSLDPKRGLYISCSSASTSAVGFEDYWGEFLEGEDMTVLLRAAIKRWKRS
jgi:hypothetical protein